MAIFEACRFFVGHIFDLLKLLAVFVGHLGIFSLLLLAVFLLLLSAVLEAYYQPSWKLLTIFVGCLFVLLFLSAVLEDYHCFNLPFLQFCNWQFLFFSLF